MAKKNRLKKEAGNSLKSNVKSPSKKGSLVPVKKFFKSERTHKIFGLFLILLSIYCTIAFTSFLFTWKIDQSILSGSWWELISSSSIEAENWLGKIGAMVSHVFIHQWFGLGSFLFVLLFFIAGFRILFKTYLLPPGKTLKYSFFGMLVISIAMGYLFSTDNTRFLGGSFGFQVNQWLEANIGSVGGGFLILFIVSGFIIVAFNPSFAFLSALKQRFANDMKGATATNAEFEEEDLMNEQKEFKDTLGEMDDFKTSAAELAMNDEDDDEEEDMFPYGDVEEQGDEGSIELDKAILTPEEEMEEMDEEDKFSIEVATSTEKELSEDELNQKVQEFGEYDPTLDLSNYQMPKLDLLVDYGGGKITVSKEELEENKNKIVTTLGNYKIGIEKIKATIGPTVTLYEIIPEPGVRISKIKNLEDDIALSLAALGIRIIAPIPGKGTIGIEVPNSNPDIVSMRTLIASEKFQNSNYELPLALGKTISNESFIADLAKMPHLLMAGATGQGKSVGLNAILISLLYKKHPAQIKFVLVDPKKVELTLFNKIERHFLAKLPGEEEAIITDTGKVVNTLNSLCVEMDNRYEMLKDAQVRNIKEYNAKFIQRKLNPEKGHHFLPYIVLVVDEFADLIMTAGKEVETPIARLAQLARAIGIHLIIATQRPSVNIITGTIKANFPARIAFRVTSKIDSRTILDSGGADQLIGRGDMLLSTGSDIIRLQCGFVDTPEVDEITEFIGNQKAYPDAFLLPEFIDESGEGVGELEIADRDAMFEDAARIIVIHQQGSASLLQRKLKLGYNRAGRIVDQLEAAGIIGPFEGSKARQVLIPDEYSLEQLLRKESEKIEN